MQNIIIYDVDKEKPADKNNGIFVVIDSSKYYFKVGDSDISELKINSNYSESMSIQVENKKTKKNLFFKNSLGYYEVEGISNGQIKDSIPVEVISTKMSYLDAKNLFSYIYEKYRELINSNLERHPKHYVGEKHGLNLLFISEQLVFIDKILALYKKLYPAFKIKPFSRLRKKLVLFKYHNQKIDTNSMKWLLSHLSELEVNDVFEDSYGAFELNGQYAQVKNIQTAETEASYNIYENRILLGALVYIQKQISSIEKDLNNKLNGNTLENYRYDYASIDSVKAIIYAKNLDEIDRLKREVTQTLILIKRCFPDTSPLVERPRYTHAFHVMSHYKSIFIMIQQLFNYEFKTHGSGDDVILGIKNLDRLYEWYVFFRIIDGLKKLLDGHVDINVIKKRAHIELPNSYDNKFTFLYEPNIKPVSQENHSGNLVYIASIEKNRSPDFVLKYEYAQRVRYAILDAKYTKEKNLKSKIKETALKYVINVGVVDHNMQKTEYLALLYPERSSLQNGILRYTKEGYFPMLCAVHCISEANDELMSFLEEILIQWNIMEYAIEPQ